MASSFEGRLYRPSSCSPALTRVNGTDGVCGRLVVAVPVCASARGLNTHETEFLLNRKASWKHVSHICFPWFCDAWTAHVSRVNWDKAQRPGPPLNLGMRGLAATLCEARTAEPCDADAGVVGLLLVMPGR